MLIFIFFIPIYLYILRFELHIEMTHLHLELLGGGGGYEIRLVGGKISDRIKVGCSVTDTRNIHGWNSTETHG